MDLKKQLGKNIQKYRKLNNITQEKLAEIIDVEINSISAIECGRFSPSTTTLERIASSLNITLADLFTFSQEETCANFEKEILKNLAFVKNDKTKLKAINSFIKSIL